MLSYLCLIPYQIETQCYTKMLFTVDLSYIQNIKQLVNSEQTMNCMTSLFSRLCDRFDALTDDPLYVVCTRPKVRTVDGVESIQK
jgi:isocitrate dehydrogenase kinase/phosphatase